MSAEWKDKGAAPLSEEFKKAAEEVKKLKATPSNEQKLTVSF
jgi:acyl-CoA-binding protein